MAIYIPTTSPESWRALLADPEKHWATGYSAKALACCWEAAKGLPPEIENLFGRDAELLIGIPEHKVPLRGGDRPSQSDLFTLIRVGDRTIACTVEGKVNEPFGPTVGDWSKDASVGKTVRLAYLCALLGLEQPLPHELRYQLLHRAASAVIEAGRFKTDDAAMVIHSFSPIHAWFDDFAAFVRIFGRNPAQDALIDVGLRNGRRLWLGWAQGGAEFLA